MRSLLFVFLVACGGGAKSTPAPTTPPPPGPAEPAPVEATADTLPECKPATPACAIQTLDVFKNRMCACQDKACADKVNTDMTTWGQAIANDPAMQAKPTEEEARRATEIATQYGECMTKLLGAEPPPENPCG